MPDEPLEHADSTTIITARNEFVFLLNIKNCYKLACFRVCMVPDCSKALVDVNIDITP